MSLSERNVRILQNKTYWINWVCCSIIIYNSNVSVHFPKLSYFNSFTSQNIHVVINNTNEKVLGDTQICLATLAVARRRQKFSPRRRPIQRSTGWPKFNQLEMVTTFTYKPSLVKIDAQFRVIMVIYPHTNKPTNIHSHKPTDRTDYNTMRRS